MNDDKHRYAGSPHKNESARASAAAYWKENIKILSWLLVIWFAVSFGAGILFADLLNNIQFAGFKLGFWFAQQGSIYTFVVLIFVYVWKMNQLDRKYDVHEE
ncbi:hypothetical protein CAI21_11325 [Alkalilimnicola ehrlichii]|uniref:Sodium symporter small subunit domain-containing protein n=1 Tax=Alkalilimnicola ehrlichii TaxID=351052 RepID=A0A3E0X0F9_9GAMM|nr:DUF4212 domain-containing protein [Alkalilimnicola ehrlichii]RFA29029.1 hypothetical protein CAI21_11325 [Alkalilimnicola ehrlichii]RFA38665.1 hypothetical protein CAL65_04875 [Alkalilimnicola ehrlichii]